MKQFYAKQETNYELKLGDEGVPSSRYDTDRESDRERRKVLSLETNRRRRDMALRVKRQIEREEERRRQVLQQRKTKQEELNSKIRLRKKRFQNIDPHKTCSNQENLDKILELVRQGNTRKRHNSPAKFKQIDPEIQSPMARYNGRSESPLNIATISQYNLSNYEAELLQYQDRQFRDQQVHDNELFVRTLQKVVQTEDCSNDSPTKSSAQLVIENLEMEEHTSLITDSLEIEPEKEEEDDETPEESDTIEEPPEELDKESLEAEEQQQKAPVRPKSSHPNNIIRGILKTTPKFTSNPDLMTSVRAEELKDSLDLMRENRTHNSAIGNKPQHLNPAFDKTGSLVSLLSDDECSSQTSFSSRKFVRFAEDKNQNPVLDFGNAHPSFRFNSRIDPKLNCAKSPTSAIPKSVPSSTSLKPPLHPRTVPSSTNTTGSYLQHNFNKQQQPVFQPPPKPRKISIDTLDQELTSILVKAPNSPANPTSKVASTVGPLKAPVAGSPQRRIPTEFSLEKTPTEAEIDELWKEVRECLNKSRNASKPSSLQNGGAISHHQHPYSQRTSDIPAGQWTLNDTGSNASETNSIRSAPSRTIHVKHHYNVRPTLYFPGQELPVRDTITVHSNSIKPSPEISQLNIIREIKSTNPQNVSESLDEFLALEQATKSQSIPKSPQNPPTNHRSRLFSNRPITSNLNYQPRFTHTENLSNQNRATQPKYNLQHTQISLDENKVKMSLDRLNERLKQVINH